MRKIMLSFMILFTTACFWQMGVAQQGGKKYFDWSPQKDVNKPNEKPPSRILPLIQVKENKFIITKNEGK